MLFCYGEKNYLRLLDEVVFWKRQEREHTVVIRNLVIDLEEEYFILLEDWEQSFAQAEGLATRYVESIIRDSNKVSANLNNQICSFLAFSQNQSKKFIQFLNQIASESTAIRDNQTAIIVLNHIRRESEYFIGITEAFLSM